MKPPALLLAAAAVMLGCASGIYADLPQSLAWRGLSLASLAEANGRPDHGWLLAGPPTPGRVGAVAPLASGLSSDRDWAQTAPRRTSLPMMTLGVVAVQYATVFAFRNDESWVVEGHRFRDGFTQWPVWDDDSWVFNYALHPWVGSEYYLIARNRGWSLWRSLAYSAACSTFFEFFVENLLQPPSATDLLVTPLVGSLVGEARYALKEHIRRNPERTRAARFWITLLDPIDLSIGGFPDGRPRLYLNWTHAF